MVKIYLKGNFTLHSDHIVNLTVIDTILDCEVKDTFSIKVIDSIAINNISFNCNSINSMYSALIVLEGGDGAGSYDFFGNIDGQFLDDSITFETQELTSNQSYSLFFFSNSSHCDTLFLPVMHNCNCTSNTGNMDLSPLEYCIGDFGTSYILWR